MRAFLGLLVLVAGCNIPEIDGPPVADCARAAFYPDADGDGLGETDRVYIGCEAPAGWVDNADDVPDEPSDSGDSDSGDPDTGDSDPGDASGD